MSNLCRFLSAAVLCSALNLLAAPTVVYAQPGGGGPPTFTVRVQPAEVREIPRTLEFTGSIEPWRVVELSAQVSGMVQAIPIEEGQVLKQGDHICQLDSEVVEIEIQADSAELTSASADLARLESGFRTEEVQEMERQVEAEAARLARAQDDWDRRRPLVEQGVVTQSEGTQLETALQEANASLARAKARRALFVAGYRKEDIEVARAKVMLEQAELSDARRRLARYTIDAPTNCVVIERLREAGEWVREGDAVAQLVVLDPLRVQFEVPQIHLSKVVKGQKAIIDVDGFPQGSYEAYVEQIVPRSGMGTRNFPILMRLANPDYALNSGLFARIRLQISENIESILVPRTSVLVRGAETVVLVADKLPQPAAGGPPSGEPKEGPQAVAAPPPDARIREVTVRTGIEVDDKVSVEVLEGDPIKPGDFIVALGGTRLQSGMPVRILTDEPLALESSASVGGSTNP